MLYIVQIPRHVSRPLSISISHSLSLFLFAHARIHTQTHVCIYRLTHLHALKYLHIFSQIMQLILNLFFRNIAAVHLSTSRISFSLYIQRGKNVLNLSKFIYIYVESCFDKKISAILDISLQVNVCTIKPVSNNLC